MPAWNPPRRKLANSPSTITVGNGGGGPISDSVAEIASMIATANGSGIPISDSVVETASMVATTNATGIQTALEAAIAATSGWSQGSWGFKTWIQPSWPTRVPDPRNTPEGDFDDANPGEDGAGYGHQMVNWAGKSCYDRIGRRVMFCANGANSGGPTVPGYSWRYQCFSHYDELGINADKWICDRGIRGIEEATMVSRSMTADVGNNVITVAVQESRDYRFSSTGTLPAPLQPNTDYILRANGGNWEVWTANFPTQSARVTLTTAGSGTHTAWEQSRVAVHLMNTNAIDVVGRRLYKGKFRETPRRILWLDLDTNIWHAWSLNTGEPSYDQSHGLEFIDQINRLWIWAKNSSTGDMRIVEIDPAGPTVSFPAALQGSAFGNATAGYSPPIVYNPRAFGGLGGVLVGGQGTQTWKIRLSDYQVTSAGQSPNTFAVSSYRGLVLRDPVGEGWYYVGVPEGYLYYCDGTSWTQVTPLPVDLPVYENLTGACIDIEPGNKYGGIWLFGGEETDFEFTGWLFKPQGA